MTSQRDFLKEQRASGGYSQASAMMLFNFDAEKYVEFYVNRIERDHDINLDLYTNHNGLEIFAGDQLVWFGRPQDVDLLRTVRFDLFEEIVLGRITKLKKMELVESN